MTALTFKRLATDQCRCSRIASVRGDALWMTNAVDAPLLVKGFNRLFANQATDLPTDSFEFQIQHCAHILPGEQHRDGTVFCCAHFQNQIANPLPRGPKVEVSQPVVGVLEGLLPLQHQLRQQPWAAG